MWCSKVLVAYDGSAPSAKALHLARSIGAQDESVELVFAHVVKLYGLGTGAETVLLTRRRRCWSKWSSLQTKCRTRRTPTC